MAEADATHLSIGEVLTLLVDEFPDVTISKIRFLESQGLINPERTPSGYRKFYDDDVELLRCVLHEQRENFLPLKVIKERLDTGEIDPTSDLVRPGSAANRGPNDPGARTGGVGAPGAPTSGVGTESSLSGARDAEEGGSDGDDETTSLAVPTGVRMDASELAAMANITDAQLEQLTSFGLVVADAAGSYDEDALEIARVARRFLDLGVDARHLRGWRVAADREAGLFEQIIQPLVLQRNPQASEHAAAQLTELEVLGGQLRSAIMRTLLRRHLDV
ncbi:MAG: MerR family transcriptional regulator [Actinomycetota bacterium]